jgi:hypothetical protein
MRKAGIIGAGGSGDVSSARSIAWLDKPLQLGGLTILGAGPPMSRRALRRLLQRESGQAAHDEISRRREILAEELAS